MDTATEESLRKLGSAYATGALKFLNDGHGDQAALGELAVFFGTASSDMVATMYDILYRHAGPKDADAWLDKFLFLVAARVRQKGNPMTLEFSFKAAKKEGC